MKHYGDGFGSSCFQMFLYQLMKHAHSFSFKERTDRTVSGKSPSFLARAWGKEILKFPCQRTGTFSLLSCHIFVAEGRSLLLCGVKGPALRCCRTCWQPRFGEHRCFTQPNWKQSSQEAKAPSGRQWHSSAPRTWYNGCFGVCDGQKKDKFHVNKAWGISLAHLAKQKCVTFKVTDRTAGDFQHYSPFSNLVLSLPEHFVVTLD